MELKNQNTSLKILREYAKFLGIPAYNRSKNELWDYIVDTINEEIHKRQLRRPNLAEEDAHIEAELALRARNLTRQKTWKTLTRSSQSI